MAVAGKDGGEARTVQDVEDGDAGPALPVQQAADVKIRQILKRLESAHQKAPEKRSPGDYLAALSPLTSEHGMPSSLLTSAFHIATSGVLSPAQAVTLLKDARPRELGSVQVELVVRAVGRLGAAWTTKGKISKSKGVDFKVQAVCLTQLILLLPYMTAEARKALENLYGVIFTCLEYEKLRGPACHLLYLLTKRHHIKHFRITKLLSLKQTLDGMPEAQQIVGLLRLYRDYYPDLVVVELGITVRRGLFHSPDPEWASKTKEIVARHAASDQVAADDDERGGLGGERAAKRLKTSSAAPFIPSSATFSATEESRTLSEQSSLFQLGRNLDRVELPSRAGSALEGVAAMTGRSRMAAWTALLKADDVYTYRLESWLVSTLEDILQSSDYSSEAVARADGLLHRVLIFYRMQGELSPAIEAFLARYWTTYWDGTSHQKALFALLVLWRPCPFENLYSWALDPLAKHARSSSDETSAAMVRALLGLIMSWTRRRDWREDRRQDGLSTAEARASIKHLVGFADRLATSSLLMYPHSVVLRAAVLTLHDALPSLPLDYHLAILEVPSYHIVYSSLFSDISGLSLMCGVLARYKQVLESNEPRIASQAGQLRTPFDEPFTSAFLTGFNAYLMNACNLFWRGKALTKEDKNADSCGLEPVWVKTFASKASRNGRDLKVLFGMTHSAAFLNLAVAYLRTLERAANASAERWHRGPITSQSLKELASKGGLNITYSEFRVGLVDHLEERGAVGLSNFLHVSLSSLMSRPRKSALPGVSSAQTTPARAPPTTRARLS